MNLTVQLRGFDRLSLVTKRLTSAAQSGLKLGVSEAAGLFEAEAKGNAPVVTGALRDSIKTSVLLDEPEKQSRSVAPNTPYAARIEFGFVGADSLGRVYNQAAQPYMRPAFETQQSDAREAIRDGVLTAVQAVHR